MRKVIMLISDGFEEIEALGTVDILRRCEIKVSIISITGNREITSSRGIKVISDGVIENTNTDAELWDALILPGGQPNADNLRQDGRVIEAVKDFYHKEKYVCAICAAPIVLERAGIIAGRQVTSYPCCLEDENLCVFTSASVEVDGKVITGRGPGAACDFAFAIVRALDKAETAEQVRKGMLL